MDLSQDTSEELQKLSAV